MGELEPDQGPPPRAVETWTRVVGHTVVDNAGRQFCSCGWRGEAVGETVEDHLSNAWPVLVPRGEGETRSAWRARVAIMHGQAVDESGQLWENHRMGEPVRPGQPFAQNPDEYDAVEERVQVLERQLQELGRGDADGRG